MAEHVHAVRFYENSDALCGIVADFLADGLRRGEPALVIATPEHAVRIEGCLRQRSFAVESLKRLGQFVTLRARDALALFMVDGVPNADAFRHTVGGLIGQVRREHGNATLRAYGEMVDVLWKDGLESAAIRLETLWNELAGTQEFSLLCGYSMGNFYKGTAIDAIKRHHSHLVSDSGMHLVSESGVPTGLAS
jgi:hypothetical protein